MDCEKKNGFGLLSKISIVLFFVSLISTLYIVSAFQTSEGNSVKVGSLYADSNYANKLLLIKISHTAQQVADAHIYKYQIYDCTQFSTALKDKLLAQNINASCVAGYTKDLYADGSKTGGNTLHTWVEVNTGYGLIEVEATNGQIIDSNVFEDRYVILRRGLCW